MSESCKRFMLVVSILAFLSSLGFLFHVKLLEESTIVNRDALELCTKKRVQEWGCSFWLSIGEEGSQVRVSYMGSLEKTYKGKVEYPEYVERVYESETPTIIVSVIVGNMRSHSENSRLAHDALKKVETMIREQFVREGGEPLRPFLARVTKNGARMYESLVPITNFSAKDFDQVKATLRSYFNQKSSPPADMSVGCLNSAVGRRDCF